MVLDGLKRVLPLVGGGADEQRDEAAEIDEDEFDVVRVDSIGQTPDEIVERGHDLEGIDRVGPATADALERNDFLTVADVYHATDSALLEVDGIGVHTLKQIRLDIGGSFALKVADDTDISFEDLVLTPDQARKVDEFDPDEGVEL